MKCCNDSAVKVDVGHHALASGHFGSRRWWAHFGGMISGAGGKNSVEPHTQGDRVLVVAFHHIRGWSSHRCYPRRRLDLIHQSRCQTSEAFGTKPLGTFGVPRSALHSEEASYRFGLPQPGKLRASSCRRELPNYFQWRTSTPWA